MENSEEISAKVEGKGIKGYDEDEHTSFIDYDEIAPLINGIDYIWNSDKDLIKLDKLNVLYHTKDNFGIMYHDLSKDKRKIIVFSGDAENKGVVMALDELANLKDLKNIFLKAKDKLDLIKKI